MDLHTKELGIIIAVVFKWLVMSRAAAGDRDEDVGTHCKGLYPTLFPRRALGNLTYKALLLPSPTFHLVHFL